MYVMNQNNTKTNFLSLIMCENSHINVIKQYNSIIIKRKISVSMKRGNRKNTGSFANFKFIVTHIRTCSCKIMFCQNIQHSYKKEQNLTSVHLSSVGERAKR